MPSTSPPTAPGSLIHALSLCVLEKLAIMTTLPFSCTNFTSPMRPSSLDDVEPEDPQPDGPAMSPLSPVAASTSVAVSSSSHLGPLTLAPEGTEARTAI